MKPVKTIGFINKYKIYDQVISSYDLQGHISNRYTALLSYLELPSESYEYSISVPEKNQDEAAKLLSGIKEKYIVTFAPYGSVRERFFSEQQIAAVLSYFSDSDDVHVVIIGEQHKIKHIDDAKNVTKNHYSSFFTAAEIIKRCDLVISPDTSIVHLSRAFNKKIVCVYPFKILGNGANNAAVWGPNYALAHQIKLTERNIMDTDINIILNSIGEAMENIRSTAKILYS
jgi:ADP-heptose:LPS heptosyltransferase